MDRDPIGTLPLSFFGAMLILVITAGLWLPLADELALNLHQMTRVEQSR